VIVGLGLTGLFFVLSALLAPFGALPRLFTSAHPRSRFDARIHQAAVAVGMIISTAAVVAVARLPWRAPLTATGAVLFLLLGSGSVVSALTSRRPALHRARRPARPRHLTGWTVARPSVGSLRPGVRVAAVRDAVGAELRRREQTGTADPRRDVSGADSAPALT
jgi:hypothetical protein